MSAVLFTRFPSRPARLGRGLPAFCLADLPADFVENFAEECRGAARLRVGVLSGEGTKKEGFSPNKR